jgi:hypothetical protein
MQSTAASASPTWRCVIIVATIHRQALRLRLKGVRLAPGPHAATANARNTCLANGETRAYIKAASIPVGQEPGPRESVLVQ